ncbi:hypothetical protein [Cohnella massiliensis]|uniref:hypothetical protein n=1 Tax=Cohnella massiliensis TaxID=1816691 RepID=UPI00111B4796|nr:hypothetical protein [Cohnella massiliensis]
MGENAEKNAPDWTKSNEDDVFREKTGFDWTKSNQASPSAASSRSIPLNPAQSRSIPLNPAQPRSIPLNPALFEDDVRRFTCAAIARTAVISVVVSARAESREYASGQKCNFFRPFGEVCGDAIR